MAASEHSRLEAALPAAVRDDAAALASRTFRVNSFLASRVRITPAGMFERLALMRQIFS